MFFMKKEDDLEQEMIDDGKGSSFFPIKISTIVLLVLFIFLTVSFSIILSYKTDEGLGFSEIVFSIVLSLVLTLFLSWVGAKIENNPHLFFSLGIIFLGSGIYALFQRFKGPYTTTFAVISGVIVLTYLFIRFFSVRKNGG
jgi:ABC-type multidrug transport system permease subunit